LVGGHDYPERKGLFWGSQPTNPFNDQAAPIFLRWPINRHTVQYTEKEKKKAAFHSFTKLQLTTVCILLGV
jgi:hypothetical protein